MVKEDKEKLEFEGLLNAYIDLFNSGSKELAKQVHKELINKITLIPMRDWINRQVCGSLPLLDPKCLIFCCSPTKNCPSRMLALSKLGLTTEDYTMIKKALGEKMMNGVIKK